MRRLHLQLALGCCALAMVLLNACGAGPPDRALQQSEWTCPSCGQPGIEVEHHCGLTSLCPSCGAEAGAAHQCGQTHFCPTCEAESGSGHVCGVTGWCAQCRAEREQPHHH